LTLEATTLRAGVPLLFRERTADVDAIGTTSEQRARIAVFEWRFHARRASDGDRYAQRVEVTVERETAHGLLVTLATDEWEVHLRLSETDIAALVGSAHWREHGTMQAGQSAGAAVFWASDGKQATLLIGNDAKTPGVAITIPFRVVDEIVRGATSGDY